MDLLEIGAKIGLYFVPFLFALCFHEFAHGWVALKKGDRTALQMGRLSLNPAVHADMVGTYILPLMVIITGAPIFFGWAKPVPVNPRNLKNETVDMFWIALAGPLSNVLLAIVGAFGYVIFRYHLSHLSIAGGATALMFFFIRINLALAIFNMIPIHPLDGGKVLARFLPPGANRWMEENQMMLNMALLVLFISGMLSILTTPIENGSKFLVDIAKMVLI
ncbi:MAG: site-2 protease family protein [Bdellovibrionales bacterium]